MFRPERRWLFPEAPLSLNMGFGDSRAWWIIDFARIQEDRAAGRIRDLSIEIPKAWLSARERLLAFLKELPRQLPIRPQEHRASADSHKARCSPVMPSCRPTIHLPGLVQLSGNLLASRSGSPLMRKRKGLPVFQSHGTQDDILPHIGAERLRDALTQCGSCCRMAQLSWRA